MSRKVYFIQETVTDRDGNYIPCVAVENILGFYRTDWDWGSDFNEAQLIADRMNERLGITKHEATTIQLSTMR